MGITGQVEDHEVLAWLGDAAGDFSAGELDDFKRWAKDNPEGDWERKLFALLDAKEMKPGDVPLSDIDDYVAGHGHYLAGEDFIAFAAYCRANPEASWARVLQRIVSFGESVKPSESSTRCAWCNRWIYQVMNEAGTRAVWIHHHTNTGTGQQNRTCGHSGELGATATPAYSVAIEVNAWLTVANLIAGPMRDAIPQAVTVQYTGPARKPELTITCKHDKIHHVIRWARCFNIDISEVTTYGTHHFTDLDVAEIIPGWTIKLVCDAHAATINSWVNR